MLSLNTMDFIHKQSKLWIGVLCLIIISILYTVAIYTGPQTIISNLKQFSPEPLTARQELCYSSELDTFPRNHLRQPVIHSFVNASIYINITDASKNVTIPSNFTNLTDFIEHLRMALLARRLQSGTHSISTIFHHPPYKHMVKPSCDGLWMEFGVFNGATLSTMANWKARYCNYTKQPVYGFDTFQGLPTDWRPGFGRGAFSIGNGTHLKVPNNTVLVKGLFIDTLPVQLRLFDSQYKCHTPVSFIHIDCDIYDGARDVLFLLSSRFVRGTIIVFDELLNYPTFEKHEVKAFYELLASSNIRLMPLGTSTGIVLNTTYDIGIQTFGFVVV